MSSASGNDGRAPVSPTAAGGSASRRKPWLVGGGVLAVALLAAGVLWWPGGGKASRAYSLAPESALPARVRAAPPAVREAYRFAIANREILSQVPCYCGCGAVHQNNYQCYVKAVNPDGSFVFDDMSLG